MAVEFLPVLELHIQRLVRGHIPAHIQEDQGILRRAPEAQVVDNHIHGRDLPRPVDVHHHGHHVPGPLHSSG